MKQFADRKLSAGVVWSYVASSLGTNCLWMLNNYFLLFFYTDVIQIPAAAATVILFIARVWDAVNDPMMGVLCDKTHHKEGRSRFWLKRMAVPAAVCVALSYFCPFTITPVKVVWVGVTYILQGMAQTAVGVPLSSLRVSMTTNRVERVKLSQYMAVPSAFANFAIPALTMPFVRSFGEDRMAVGFAVLAAIIGVIYGVSTFLVYRATKGYDPDTSEETNHAETGAKGPGGLQLIKAALQNKYCLLVCLAYCSYLLLAGIMGSTLIYYFRYNLSNENLMGTYSTMAVIGNIVSILTMRIVGKKFGNAMSCILGGGVCLVGLALRIATGDQVFSVFVIGMLLLGFGSGFVSNMIHQCILDATTYGRLRGMDNQSVVMSIFTFAQKFGQAASSVLAAALLAVFNYTAGDVPSESILRLFYVENLIVPVVIAVIMIALLLVIHKMEKQMLKDLQAQTSTAG